jgi:formate dehydrogenase major subunit
MTAWTADPGNGVPAKDQYIYGLMCWGQNPAVGGASCDFERKAMENLDWLVCVDLWETETAAFWKRPGVDPTTINTEVYLLPAAASYEKEGSIVNSGRWSQWRYKALNPPGLAMDDLSIISELAQRLIALYQADGGLHANIRYPLALLWWGPYCDPAGVASGGTPHEDAHGQDGSNYDDGNVDARTGLLEANPHKVGWEINGYFCPSAGGGSAIGTRVDGFWGGNAVTQTLRYNGETSSGNWLYCSHYVNPGDANAQPNGNRQENRNPVDAARPFPPPANNKIGLFSNWSYCWPLNRRIIYNGASVYQTGHPSVGQPLAPQKWVVAWDAGGTVYRTPGNDVTDGFKPPGAAGARMPFIMQREGVAHLFGPGREDGPFPEHYEPWETVLTTNPISQTLTSPTNFGHVRPEAYEHPGHGNPEFPIVGTTYRVSEHWQAGQLTRNNPWLCELQPDAFVELSEELASILGISNGDMTEIKTKRSNVTSPSGNYGKTMQAVACVTKRFKPYTIAGDTVHHVGVIWHFGYTGYCTGDSANLLTPHIGDANTGIPESKAFICNLRKLGGSWLS